MGAIADIVKRYVPASYKALVGATNSYDYTAADLQALADFVQYSLYATVPGATNEASWDYEKRQLIGMLTTIQFIPAAIDYWGDQLETESTRPTSETVSYFDRRPDLWKLLTRLQEEAESLSGKLGVTLAPIRGYYPKVSYGDNGRNILVTSDPQEFGSAFNNSSMTTTGVDWTDV